MSYKDSNREHNRSLSRDTSPLKDQYADIYRDQSKYAEILKRQEREAYEKQRKLKEDREYEQLLDSLQTNLDNSIAPRPKVFIAGMFPRGSVSAVVAAPGTGKSWFLQLLASNLSVGGSVFNGFAEEKDSLKSLIFAGEAGVDLLFQRAYETHWPINKENIVVVGLIDAEKKNISLMLDKESGQNNIEHFVKKNRPDIMFFDTFASFHNKNENKSDDMKPIIRFLSMLAEKYNMAVVLLHHTRKSPAKMKKKPITLDDAIGSSVLIRLISVIIAIEAYSAKESEEDYISVKKQSIQNAENRAESKTMVVKVLKTWFSDFSPFTFSILTENGKTSVTIDLMPTFNEGEKVKFQAFLLDYIRKTYDNAQWFKSSEIPTKIPVDDSYYVEISYRHIQRLLTIMVNQGCLRKKGFGRSTVYQSLQ